MMELDSVLLRELYALTFSQFLFTFFKKVVIDGWNCVMKVMCLSLDLCLELHVKDLVPVICEVRLICSEINFYGLTPG